ncbi:MAG: rRNA pseudouridine synthase [Myxococcales bacterium]|nr:rRNA pseudouridine synthase [Myxococcales bacterium]
MKQQIRLQKVLAQAGVASRRRAERMIAEGRVSINGQVVTSMGVQIEPHVDRIEVDNKPLNLTFGTPLPVTLLLHKPSGVMCTASDPDGRKTVFDLLDAGLPRLFSIGRLDYGSEGALLLTNDGELAHAMMHPKFKIPKTYEVRVKGRLDAHHFAAFEQGMLIDGKPTLPVQITEMETTGKNGWYRIVLSEGRNRQIRKMMEQLGFLVARLRRTSIGNIELGNLRPGAYRTLTSTEVQELLRSAANQDTSRVGLAGSISPTQQSNRKIAARSRDNGRKNSDQRQIKHR